MKEFTVKVERILEFEVNPYRRHIGIALILIPIFCVFLLFLNSTELRFTLAFSILLLVGLPDAYKMARNNYRNETISEGECVLEFGEQKLICKYKNKIKWSLPLNKLSHIETQYIGTGKWFAPRTKATFVFSNVGTNDTYPLPGAISEKDQQILQNEITALKNIKAV